MKNLTAESERELFNVLELTLILQREGIATIFFEISGHVEWLYIRVYRDQWVTGADIDGINNISLAVQLKNYDDIIKAKCWLQEMLLNKSVIEYTYKNSTVK